MSLGQRIRAQGEPGTGNRYDHPVHKGTTYKTTVRDKDPRTR
jgi:hypothetical protein